MGTISAIISFTIAFSRHRKWPSCAMTSSGERASAERERERERERSAAATCCHIEGGTQTRCERAIGSTPALRCKWEGVQVIEKRARRKGEIGEKKRISHKPSRKLIMSFLVKQPFQRTTSHHRRASVSSKTCKSALAHLPRVGAPCSVQCAVCTMYRDVNGNFNYALEF